MTDRYAVVGNPIAHSRSPEIHAAFARQTGQDIEYGKLLAPENDFPGTLDAFQKAGGRGVNVTVPFKEQAFALMGRVSERARRAEAVNTILFHADGSREGDNTDGAGLVRDLRDNHRIELRDRHILLLGAGGAARGVLPDLIGAGPARIAIANRTASRAEALAARFNGATAIEGGGYERVHGAYDIVINATSASLTGTLPPLRAEWLRGDAVCYDMVYGNEATPFQRWARHAGAAVAVDGLGMLIEQAAEAFFIWRDVRPNTAPVIARLREGRGT